MLTLTQGSTAFDLSRFVDSWQFDVDPSFSFNELSNGLVYKASDIGNASDKYYCDLQLNLPFKSFQDFLAFAKSTASGVLTISTDLDLFWPNKYDNLSCTIISIKDAGYSSGDIFTRSKAVDVRLYLTEVQTYATVSEVPYTLLDKAIWSQVYTPGDVFNVSSVGVTYHKHSRPGENKWSVDFQRLSRSEAGTLLAWILNVRTNSVTLDRKDLNANLSNSSTPFTLMTSSYLIHDFTFKHQGAYYTAELDLFESVDR